MLSLAGLLACAYVTYQISERIGRAWEARAVRRGASFVNLVVALKRRGYYLPRLKALAERSDLDTPRGRADARAALAALIAPEDVCGGFLANTPRTGNAARDGWTARAQWQGQMQQAGIAPHTGRRGRKALRPLATVSSDGVCMVGVVATTNAPPPTAGGTDEAITALLQLRALSGDAFYFYYAPGEGEALSLGDAHVLMARLRQDFVRPAPNRVA